MFESCENKIELKGPIKDLEEFHKQFDKPHKRFFGTTITTSSIDDVVNSDTDYLQASRVKGLNNFIVNSIEHIENHSKGGSLSNFIPETKESFLSGWYKWRMENWGCKKDISHYSGFPLKKLYKDNNNNFENGLSEYRFYTLQSAPVKVTIEMSKKFPILEFNHIFMDKESENAGYFKIVNGEIILNEIRNCEDLGYMDLIEKITKEGI